MDIGTRSHGQSYFIYGRHEAHGVGVLAEGTNTMEFHQRLKDGSKDPLHGRSSPKLRSRGAVSKSSFSVVALIHMVLIASSGLIKPSTAAFMTFRNCLSREIINADLTQSKYRPLQFQPFFVDAAFNTSAASRNLNVTVYGNVSGIATQESYPALDDPQWGNPNETVGKIPNISSSNYMYTTLKFRFNVLSYTPYQANAEFCNSTIQGQCPLGPSFNANASNPAELSAFSVAHNFYSSYAFTTIDAILRVVSGDEIPAPIACVSVSITPGLGDTISNILTYVPLVVLILVAVATACAAVFSPWGSMDIFRWTSNYGRDADLLRLVTPGFGDCLQYIQFAVLAGSLSLNYPGFYQPVVSKVGWSALMFNQSFISHGGGARSLTDGVYTVNGTYGLDRMSQYVGMTADKDIWAGMAVWLLAILAAFVALIQIGFLGRWGYRHISHTQQEDLRAKNIPFTVGNLIRIVFNYFLLPIVAFSTYQLVIASRSPSGTVGLAAILLFACVGFAAWLLWLIASTRPRSYLFDDLPTVLLYGPLYNTYSDNAATFALVPVMLMFIRGIAIGGVQHSGIAQLVLLAICEVILILTLNAFRPFHSPTSMNAFHTFFAVVRLLSILLSVAFVPSLGVGDAPRGWIGYVILLMHAIVLVFGFFLNAFQTLIEVIARIAGAGGEEGVGGGAARGGLAKVFGMRQLSRRNPRRRGQARHSMASDANILGQESDQRSVQFNGGRSRSMSGSSAILLNRQPNRTSTGLDSVSAAGARHSNMDNGSAPYTPTISGGASAFSYIPGASHSAGIVNLTSAETSDPWYRPPRARRPTNEALLSRTRSQGSWGNIGLASKRRSYRGPEQEGSPNPSENLAEGPSTSGRATPIPLHFGPLRDRSESNLDDSRRSKTDYAIREVDFYYGVRGPALSTLPTRRLKTGPADPTGPVSSATGWFKGLFGGKTKDKGKGFEVVRSSKAPPTDRQTQLKTMTRAGEGPYFDDPATDRSRDLELSDDGDAIGGGTRHLPEEHTPGSLSSEDEYRERSIPGQEDPSTNRTSQVSQFSPSLPTIETGNGIELPSRVGSKASSRPTRANTRANGNDPPLHRQRSRRDPQHENFGSGDGLQLSTVAPSPLSSSKRSDGLDNADHIHQVHLQPLENVAKRLPFESRVSSSQETHASTGLESGASSLFSPISNGVETAGHARHSSSALGALAPDLRQDRPSSIGYVHQHRASDNIHTALTDEPPLLGSSAEVHHVLG